MAQQIVQSNHATYAMAIKHPNDSVYPSIVLIGVPNKFALENVIKRLETYHIEYEAFIEPDFDMGLSAVATIPVTAEQRNQLQNYNIWKERNNHVVDTQRETKTTNDGDVPVSRNDSTGTWD